MKVFQNKNLFKKLIIFLLIIVIFSFCVPNAVKATDDGIGGKLLNPIVDLVLSFGDGFYNIIHRVILQQDVTLLHIDLTSNFWEVVLTAVVFIVVAVAAVAAIIASAGFVATLIPALASVVSMGIGTTLVVATATGAIAATVFNAALFPDDEIVLPLYSISPEEIFSNDLVIFDVDFFNPEHEKILKDENGDTIYDKEGNKIVLESTSSKLKKTVSNWYVVLRDIAIVALLSILVYIGIRIVISSTSNDKAKYKQMLVDWIVAICLLFSMQYIMSFSNLLVEKVTDVISGINYENKSVQIIPDKDGKVSERLKKDYEYTDDQIEEIYVKDGNGNYIKDSDGNKELYWNTNLIGVARLNAQMGKNENTSYAGYAIVFIILVFYTIFFIWTYLKRVIYMAFLTLIAPLVAMTYPIDKINDGKAQAFDMWFKEYIFNLLIQPMHLILYTILVTSAFELSSKNILYTLVALGFIVPAEKLLRKFFGFEKAQTPGLLAGPAGAMATMGMMNKLLSKRPSKGGKSSSGSGGSSKEIGDQGNKDIKFKDDLPGAENTMLGEGNSNITESDNNLGGTTNNNLSENDNNLRGTTNNNLSEIGSNELNQTSRPSIEDSLSKAGANTANRLRDFGSFAANNTQLGLGAQQLLNNGKEMANSIKNNESVSAVSRKIKNRPRSRIAKAGTSAARYYAKGMKNKISNKIKNGHPVKAAVRTAGSLATGAAAASIGLAAGVVSGDPTKAVQYTAGAALGGYKFGGSIIDGATNTFGVDGTGEILEKAYYGEEEYKERQIQKNIREAQKDFNMQSVLEDKFGKERVKELNKTVVPECVRYGISNPKDIVAVTKLQDEGIDKYKAMQAAISVNEYGKNTSKLGAKDSEDLDKTLFNRAKKNSKINSDEEANQVAKDTRNLMNRFSDIKYKK